MPSLSLTRRVAVGLMYPTEIATPFHRDGWVYEEKADGYRMAAVKVDNCLGLISRHGTHYAHRFPELVAAIGALDAETFILDGSHDLYGKRLRLAFVKYLRPELKFDGLDPLKAQMTADVAEAAALFRSMGV